MKLFSIKARSSIEGIHLSGAERIVPENQLKEVLDQIYEKVSRKDFDFINIKLELIKEKPIFVEKSLKIKNLNLKNYIEANNEAVNLLNQITKIPAEKIKKLIKKIHSGASPDGSNMRGAMIVNQRGERIEIDNFRGVRTSMVDFINREKITEKLVKNGYTIRTADALALTTKNMLYPDMIAEYCISDEPDYLTGYIATKDEYIRLNPLKEKGNPKGGRIYFVKNDINLEDFYEFLQNKPVLIKDVDLQN